MSGFPHQSRVAHDELTKLRWHMVRRAARVIYSRGAEHVWVFGSLAMGATQYPNSDYDLVVAGLQPGQGRGLRRELGMMLGNKVDIVEMERANHAIRDHVLRTRVLIPRDELGT